MTDPAEQQALKLRVRALELSPTGGGTVGPPGPPGPTGPTGATGAQGPKGDTGAQGTQGPQGTPGAKWLSGASAPAAGLGVVGDWYLNTTTSDAYEKTGGSAWTLRVNIKGAPGATGSQGPQGATGSQGPQGVKGDTGATGTQGPQGNPGTAGTPGEKWFSGTGAPSGATGIVGDWYLNDANGDVYEKTGAAAWTLRDNLTGPQGIQGIQGIQGVQGPAGAPTKLAQTIAGSTLPVGTTSVTLTSVPTAKTVLFTIPIVFRIPSANQYCVAQIFDGATQVGTDFNASSSNAGGQVMMATVAITGYTFTATPTLKLYANVSTPMDAAKLMGLSY